MEKPVTSSSSSEFDWLDEFLDSVEVALGFMDLSTLQPTSWRHVHPLFSKEWIDWFSSIVEASRNASFEEIGKAFNAGWVRAHLLFSMEDAKAARTPMEKRLRLADFFYNALKAEMPQGDLFGLGGTTRLHTKFQARQFLEQKFEAGAPEVARALGRLYNAAYNLGAAIYLDFYMDKAIENFGPYELGDGRTLVIKEMRFLKPKEIWPEIGTCADRLRLYAVYKNVKFSNDFIACHSQYEGDPISGLDSWRLEKDGKPVTEIGEINEIMLNFADVGKTQWKTIMGLPETELIKKTVWLRCYLFKPVCDLLGLDWKPTKELLAAVEGKTLKQGWETWKQPTEEKEYKQYWRRILDPRKEFYP